MDRCTTCPSRRCTMAKVTWWSASSWRRRCRRARSCSACDRAAAPVVARWWLPTARAVAALFPGESLLDEQVTLENLRRLVPEADIVHLATHGVARLDMPLFSYLRLADGHLTALDCFELELDCALVTLSACESGGGVVAAGDEQIGLPRAFLYAGARSVLHSLWRIDDLATQVLMERFYAELRAGRGRGASLRNAQLAALRSIDAHPFLWAALVLVGDWR